MQNNAFILTDYIGHLKIHDKTGNILLINNRYASSIVYTYAGKIRFSFDSEILISDPGHPIFLPEGCSYLNECLDEANSIMFTFHADNTLNLQILPIPHDNFYERYYEELDFAVSEHELTSKFAIFSCLYKMLHELASSMGETKKSFVNKAVGEMNLHYDDPDLSIREIAQKLFISDVYLRKLFLRETGITPYQYLLKIRMEKATMLLSEQCSVKEIAYAIGYSNIYQFSRAYKKFFGIAPSIRRKQCHIL